MFKLSDFIGSKAHYDFSYSFTQDKETFRMKSILRTLACVFVSAASFSSQANLLEFQTFDNLASATAAGWQGVGNSSDGHSYGFSSTNFTGGVSPTGEAGGVVARGGNPSFYADLTLGGTLTRRTPIQASGEFDIVSISTDPAFDGSLFVAHFNYSAPILTTYAGLVGVRLNELTSNSVRLQAELAFADGSTIRGNELILGLFPDSDRLWSYTWDPDGGSYGKGQLMVVIDGPGGGSSVLELTSADDGTDFELNAFGLSVPISINPNPNRTVTAFIDNTTYTSAVPESTSAVLLGLGLLGLLGRCWRSQEPAMLV